MILVAGLAIAGLAGIAAAFYFSIRSGRGGDKRLRSGRAGGAGAGRRAGSRSHATRNYRAEASTGPNPVLDFADPLWAAGGALRARRWIEDLRRPANRGGRTGRDRAEPSADAWQGDAGSGESWPGDASAGDPQATDPGLGSGDKTSRPRRRVGFRKGADVDEELWPADEFGGVSDEQFWDDLASDKPLTTTARTAQQDPRTRNRPLAAGPPAATQPVQKMPPAQKTQPVRKTQPVQKMPPAQSMPAPVPTATQPVQAAAAASRPVSATAASRSRSAVPPLALSQCR